MSSYFYRECTTAVQCKERCMCWVNVDCEPSPETEAPTTEVSDTEATDTQAPGTETAEEEKGNDFMDKKVESAVSTLE